MKNSDIVANSINFDNKEIEKFRFLLGELTEEYIKKFKEIYGAKKKDFIPTNIFNKKLSPLETIVKYLKENLDLSFKEIGYLLNRNQKTVWQAYKNSKKKYTLFFKGRDSKYNIPISFLKNRKYSILESVVAYLKENCGITYHQTALALNRDERTIWTVYKRAKEKRGKR